MVPFESARHDLGDLSLHPLSSQNADKLGQALADMPPWSVVQYHAERLASSLNADEPSITKFEVMCADALAGVLVIQEPFLHGPYLKLIAILADFQGRGVGLRLLQWMESEARRARERQLWLCVSTFNDRARAFYERFGFEPVAVLDKLAMDNSDELFMRKRLL